MRLFVLKAALILALFMCLSNTVTPPITIATFKAVKMISYNDTNKVAEGYSALATLFETPSINGLRPYKGVKDGTLSLNNINVGYNNFINMYVDSLQRPNLTNINWSLRNAIQHENFDFSASKAIPSFNNIVAIPNSISKSANFIMHLGNIPNVDKIEFNIDNEQILIDMPFYKKLSGNSGNVTIQKKDLAILNPNNLTSIRITLINEEQKIYNNNTYIFEHRLEIIKYVSLVN